MSYAKLEKYAIWSGTYAEINKTKLDMLKTFSPIPIIIFILGVYTNNSPRINKKDSALFYEYHVKRQIKD